MYWIGVRPGDVHLNSSSPGWAKHAWSNVFAPWNAQACVFVYNYARFDATALLGVMDRCGVTSFCAPPTVWRMLIQADLTALRNPPRAVVAAGEPLNPEVIDQVGKAWGVTVRDGFGQTETTVQVANTPGQPLKPGSMGRAAPGYRVVLVDPLTGEPGEEGEICLDLSQRPLGLMVGYHGDAELTANAMAGGYYHTGDIGSRDADGHITYEGRTDDGFKASDYRISPSGLEGVLLEHAADPAVGGRSRCWPHESTLPRARRGAARRTRRGIRDVRLRNVRLSRYRRTGPTERGVRAHRRPGVEPGAVHAAGAPVAER